MAIAAFKLIKKTASAEADCNKNPCFLNADIISTATGTYPIAIPTSGSNYSYENYVYLECITAPNTKCENFKFYGPSYQPDSPTNKLTVYVGTTGVFINPTNNASSVANVIQHSNYVSVGTGLVIGVVPVDNIINAIGEQSRFIVIQLKVDVGASQAFNLIDFPFTITYEES